MTWHVRANIDEKTEDFKEIELRNRGPIQQLIGDRLHNRADGMDYYEGVAFMNRRHTIDEMQAMFPPEEGWVVNDAAGTTPQRIAEHLRQQHIAFRDNYSRGGREYQDFGHVEGEYDWQRRLK